MSLKIEWVDGAPVELLPGMMVEVIGKCSGAIRRFLVGDISKDGGSGSCYAISDILRHGYLIKPHELEWLSHMAGREAKARPEE